MSIPVPNLKQITLDLIAQVPCGKVTTFRALALALGDAIASRAVGIIVAEAQSDTRIPTHRVVYSNGEIGPSKSDEHSRIDVIERLRAEGVPIDGWRVQNLAHNVFYQFDCDPPLVKLKQIQSELSSQVTRESRYERFESAGGVDLSYENYWLGVGAYVEMSVGSETLIRTELAKSDLKFPYIPTYLAHRELPVLLHLLETARERAKLADVILVDGTGILHPRHAGIASQLGILMDVSTIGVTKKMLYGSVAVRGMETGEVRSVIDPEDGKPLGAAIKTSARAAPIYVSVGHAIDLESAIELVLKLAKHKLPEPIHRAHLLSKEVASAGRPSKRDVQQALDL